jgi:hypothetical protein
MGNSGSVAVTSLPPDRTFSWQWKAFELIFSETEDVNF